MRLLLAVLAVAGAMPHLHLVGKAPLELRGDDFRSAEQVTVVVTLGSSSTRRIARSGRNGVFAVRFQGLVYDRCHGELRVRAIGSKGSRAAFTLQPLDCPAGAGG
jgi:hypothetical protein